MNPELHLRVLEVCFRGYSGPYFEFLGGLVEAPADDRPIRGTLRNAGQPPDICRAEFAYGKGFAVSERVLRTLCDEGLAKFDAFPIDVTEVMDRRPTDVLQSQYYLLFLPRSAPLRNGPVEEGRQRRILDWSQWTGHPWFLKILQNERRYSMEPCFAIPYLCELFRRRKWTGVALGCPDVYGIPNPYHPSEKPLHWADLYSDSIQPLPGTLVDEATIAADLERARSLPQGRIVWASDVGLEPPKPVPVGCSLALRELGFDMDFYEGAEGQLEGELGGAHPRLFGHAIGVALVRKDAHAPGPRTSKRIPVTKKRLEFALGILRDLPSLLPEIERRLLDRAGLEADPAAARTRLRDPRLIFGAIGEADKDDDPPSPFDEWHVAVEDHWSDDGSIGRYLDYRGRTLVDTWSAD